MDYRKYSTGQLVQMNKDYEAKFNKEYDLMESMIERLRYAKRKTDDYKKHQELEYEIAVLNDQQHELEQAYLEHAPDLRREIRRRQETEDPQRENQWEYVHGYYDYDKGRPRNRQQYSRTQNSCSII